MTTALTWAERYSHGARTCVTCRTPLEPIHGEHESHRRRFCGRPCILAGLRLPPTFDPDQPGDLALADALLLRYLPRAQEGA